MGKLTKQDLAKLNRPYLESLDSKTLVDTAFELRNVVIEQLEQLEKSSRNSSRPSSTDDIFKKGKGADSQSKELTDSDQNKETNPSPESETRPQPKKRPPGRQTGSQGFGRSAPPVIDFTVLHYPVQCSKCGQQVSIPEKISPYMGYYVYELERTSSGIQVVCTLHHYYIVMCGCGQEVKSCPGVGGVSTVEGRKRDLKLTEYVMTGPMLTAFIAALSSRYRMSRVKISEFLMYWMNLQLSVGTIDRCIREAGICCFPMVEKLLEELQKEEIVHIDETPWFEKGVFKWMWVVISKSIAVYRVGTRKKEELLNLITAGFMGWLISDGYGPYREFEKRQRCLAHLIRKAVALLGAVDEKTQKMGEWFLREMRGLLQAVSEGGQDGSRKCNPILARFKRACLLGKDEDHPKLRSLAREILNDWDAVIAFVKNPDLPPTNNEAERALRTVVISRNLSFGSRTSEGSRALASLLSVIETCRLRKIDPWNYIAQTIALTRTGAPLQPIPQGGM